MGQKSRVRMTGWVRSLESEWRGGSEVKHKGLTETASFCLSPRFHIFIIDANQGN